MYIKHMYIQQIPASLLPQSYVTGMPAWKELILCFMISISGV